MNRPKLILTRSFIDKIFIYATVAFVIAHWLFVIYKYSSLPEIIPIHSDLQGNIDGYGSKDTIWLLPGIATLIATGINWLCNFPHLFNYPVTITDENAVYQYTLATRVLLFINLICTALLFFISVEMIIGTKDGKADFIQWLIIAFVGLALIAPLAVYFFSNSGRRNRI